MRTLLVNPMAVLLMVAAVVLVGRLLEFNPHARELVWAALICLVAAEAGALPAVLSPKNQANAVRAALVGTAIHVLVAAGLGCLVIMASKPGMPFVLWLLAMYWLTLTVLCVEFARLVRAQAAVNKSNLV